VTPGTSALDRGGPAVPETTSPPLRSGRVVPLEHARSPPSHARDGPGQPGCLRCWPWVARQKRNWPRFAGPGNRAGPSPSAKTSTEKPETWASKELRRAARPAWRRHRGQRFDGRIGGPPEHRHYPQRLKIDVGNPSKGFGDPGPWPVIDVDLMSLSEASNGAISGTLRHVAPRAPSDIISSGPLVAPGPPGTAPPPCQGPAHRPYPLSRSPSAAHPLIPQHSSAARPSSAWPASPRESTGPLRAWPGSHSANPGLPRGRLAMNLPARPPQPGHQVCGPRRRPPWAACATGSR